MGVKLFLSC